jgi:formate hydrogenlyase subunit 4
MQYLLWIAQIALVPVLSPLVIGVVNKLKARLQKRQGASIVQPYRNLWKLFHKDEVISRDASVIFKIAPFIVFAVTLIVGASIPLFSTVLRSPMGDLITVVYLLALGTFFLALAGMDVGGPFGGFGASREMTMSALAEGSFIFSIFALALVSGATNLAAISQGIMGNYGHFLVPIVLAFIGFFVVLLGETGRYPFDNVDTHLELTMIHEAMILEYSGKRLALMEWAAANKFLIFASLAVNLFFPFGIATATSVGAVALGLLVLGAKLLVICGAVALLESVTAKLRFFRLPDWLMVAYIFNAFAIGLIR